MRKLVDLIYSYKYYLLIVLLYEFLYILLGYKGNKINIRNSEKSTDTIPCPYYFLTKIFKVIKKLKIASFTDIGCGNGRVIYFLRKKIDAKFYGFELYKDSYLYCLNLFENVENVEIYNKNFFEVDDKFHKSDCYFINDPIKSLTDHNHLFQNLINFHKKSDKQVYFVLVCVNDEKTKIFDQCKLIEKFQIGERGFSVYSI